MKTENPCWVDIFMRLKKNEKIEKRIIYVHKIGFPPELQRRYRKYREKIIKFFAPINVMPAERKRTVSCTCENIYSMHVVKWKWDEKTVILCMQNKYSLVFCFDNICRRRRCNEGDSRQIQTFFFFFFFANYADDFWEFAKRVEFVTPTSQPPRRI